MGELYQHHQPATTTATASESGLVIVVSRPVDRHLLRVPAQASIDIQLSTVVDSYMYLQATPTPSTAVADTVPTLAAIQFITTPTVWG